MIEIVAYHMFGVRNPGADRHDSRWPPFFRMVYAEIISPWNDFHSDAGVLMRALRLRAQKLGGTD
jgi:hypothetical protein